MNAVPTDMDCTDHHVTYLRQRNLRPSTIYQRRRVLARVSSSTGHRPLLALSCEDLQAYLDGRPSPEGVATELSHLRSFYRWAVITGHLEVDPTVRLVRPKTKRRLPRPTDESDVARITQLVDGRARPIVLLAGWAGLRACEIAQLRVEDILWAQKRIHVVESKGGDESSVPLSVHLAEGLRSCDLPDRGWVCPRLDGRSGPLPPWMISKLANRALREIGVTSTLHQLRHRFGTQVQRAAGDVRRTQEAMRHRSIASTVGYTLIVNADVLDAVEQIPPPMRQAG